MKSELKVWNKLVFGDINLRVDKAHVVVNGIRDDLPSLGPSDYLLLQEKLAQAELEEALNMQEQFWHDKSKLNWHLHGNRNTSFFHKVAKTRYASQSLFVLKSGDFILDDQSAIENHVLDFYSNLYATDKNCLRNNLIQQIIPSFVSEDNNQLLTAIPSADEIKSVVFALNEDGAPGPDGFGFFCYTLYWDLIDIDVYKAASQFFATDWLLPNLNSNLVVFATPFFPKRALQRK